MTMQLKKDWRINSCRQNYTQKTALKPESKLRCSGREYFLHHKWHPSCSCIKSVWTQVYVNTTLNVTSFGHDLHSELMYFSVRNLLYIKYNILWHYSTFFVEDNSNRLRAWARKYTVVMTDFDTSDDVALICVLGFMVFNATFNTISVTLCRSAILE
jgi:hypothetical protein